MARLAPAVMMPAPNPEHIIMVKRLSFLSLVCATSAFAGGAKVDICHKGDDGVFHVINISQSAVASHLTNHGDAYPATWYPDADGDGYGDPNGVTDRCPQTGLVNNGTDCDETDAAVNPGAAEIPYDGIDNDCAADSRDDDLDYDGFNHDTDCNDNDPNVNPAAAEQPYDGVDNDCNAGTPDDDLDGDGFLVADDCNDENPAVSPAAAETCDDSMDNNCDGNIDEGCAVVSDCPCFTADLIAEQFAQFDASQWQYSNVGCQDYTQSNYYYYNFDYTEIYFNGWSYNNNGYSFDQEYDYYYSIDYDDYYNQTFCAGQSGSYSYDYNGGYYNSSSDFSSFQYLTDEQHASCEQLLRDTALSLGLTCQVYNY